MPVRSRVIYLHGFASSPASRKAQFFSAQLQQLGFEVEVPDLEAGDFEHVALSKQLSLVTELARSEPVTLIGSSMGGYLAALYAAQHPKVERLILLAPAFGFSQLWADELGPERLRAWEQQGALSVFHYGQGRTVPVSFELFKDARQFPAFPNFTQPGLILHGTADTVVPIQKSIEFAAAHPNVELVQFDSDHELTNVLNGLWDASKVFLSSNRLLS